MPISSDYQGHTNTFGIGDFFNGKYADTDKFDFTYSPDSDTVVARWNGSTSDGTDVGDTFDDLPFAFAGGQGSDTWAFRIDKDFFAAHVGTTITIDVELIPLTLLSTRMGRSISG